jgi:hypothetical protein
MELESIEEQVLKAETEVEQLEAQFSMPNFHEKLASEVKVLMTELEVKKQKVTNLYERWEELETIKDLSAK